MFIWYLHSELIFNTFCIGNHHLVGASKSRFGEVSQSCSVLAAGPFFPMRFGSMRCWVSYSGALPSCRPPWSLSSRRDDCVSVCKV
jgi:hypothetical protein